MTRKHFVLIAGILRRLKYIEFLSPELFDVIFTEFAHSLATQNANFQYDTFKRAVYGEQRKAA